MRRTIIISAICGLAMSASAGLLDSIKSAANDLVSVSAETGTVSRAEAKESSHRSKKHKADKTKHKTGKAGKKEIEAACKAFVDEVVDKKCQYGTRLLLRGGEDFSVIEKSFPGDANRLSHDMRELERLIYDGFIARDMWFVFNSTDEAAKYLDEAKTKYSTISESVKALSQQARKEKDEAEQQAKTKELALVTTYTNLIVYLNGIFVEKRKILNSQNFALTERDTPWGYPYGKGLPDWDRFSWVGCDDNAAIERVNKIITETLKPEKIGDVDCPFELTNWSSSDWIRANFKWHFGDDFNKAICDGRITPEQGAAHSEKWIKAVDEQLDLASAAIAKLSSRPKDVADAIERIAKEKGRALKPGDSGVPPLSVYKGINLGMNYVEAKNANPSVVYSEYAIELEHHRLKLTWASFEKHEYAPIIAIATLQFKTPVNAYALLDRYQKALGDNAVVTNIQTEVGRKQDENAVRNDKEYQRVVVRYMEIEQEAKDVKDSIDIFGLTNAKKEKLEKLLEEAKVVDAKMKAYAQKYSTPIYEYAIKLESAGYCVIINMGKSQDKAAQVTFRDDAFNDWFLGERQNLIDAAKVKKAEEAKKKSEAAALDF